MGFKNAIWVDCRGEGRRRAGGLGLLWDNELDFDLLSYSQNQVDGSIQNVVDKKRWRFTGFYGYPEESKNDISWNLLAMLKDQCPIPWLCGGDFNEILLASKKKGGADRRG